MRTFLQAEATLAVALAPIVAVIVWQRIEGTRALRALVALLMTGLWLVLLYVAAGQIKAHILQVPFDYYSWLGVAGFTVLDVALIWALAREHHKIAKG